MISRLKKLFELWKLKASIAIEVLESLKQILIWIKHKNRMVKPNATLILKMANNSFIWGGVWGDY